MCSFDTIFGTCGTGQVCKSANVLDVRDNGITAASHSIRCQMSSKFGSKASIGYGMLYTVGRVSMRSFRFFIQFLLPRARWGAGGPFPSFFTYVNERLGSTSFAISLE